MRYLIVFFPIFLTTIIYGQKQTTDKASKGLVLVNSYDTLRKITIKNDDIVNIEMENTSFDSIRTSTNISCYVDSVSDLIIKCRIISESIYLEYPNGCYSRIRNNYQSVKDESTKMKVNIYQIKNIKYIGNSSVTRDNLFVLGNSIYGVSLFTTLIIAPLTSINFKTWSFNSKRYFTLAGSGLIGLSIGIPISASCRHKRYKLITKNQDEGRRLWYIE